MQFMFLILSKIINVDTVNFSLVFLKNQLGSFVVRLCSVV